MRYHCFSPVGSRPWPARGWWPGPRDTCVSQAGWRECLPCGQRPAWTLQRTWGKSRTPITSGVKGGGALLRIWKSGSQPRLFPLSVHSLRFWGEGRKVTVVLRWPLQKARPQPSAVRLRCDRRALGDTDAGPQQGPGQPGACEAPIPAQPPASGSCRRTARGRSSGESRSQGWLRVCKTTP